MTDAQDAHQYRLARAAQLLREAGFIEQPDGTWLRTPAGRWISANNEKGQTDG